MKKIQWAKGATWSLSEGEASLRGVGSAIKYTCGLTGEPFVTVLAHFKRVFRREDCNPSYNFDSFSKLWGGTRIRHLPSPSMPAATRKYLLAASLTNLVKLWKITGFRCRLQRQWCSWTRRFVSRQGSKCPPLIKASLCGDPQRSGQPRPSVHGWHSSLKRQWLGACNKTRILGRSYLKARLYRVEWYGERQIINWKGLGRKP